VLSEEIEARAVNGEPVGINQFCTLASTTVRLAQRLGINRVPKNITPSVKDYIASITSETTREDAA
jgi:hypothetical protein